MNVQQVIVALGEDAAPVRKVLFCVRDHPDLDNIQIALKLGMTYEECTRLILRAMEFGLLDRTFTEKD